MSVKEEFSKYSNSYEDCSIVQKFACSHLFSHVKSYKFQNILELGCGTGQFFELVNWQFRNYTAVDFSQEMCDVHPKAQNLNVKCLDFDTKEFADLLERNKYDIIVAPSSLQWSKDFDRITKLCFGSSSNIAFAIFTSNTFKTIHSICEVVSPIKDAKYFKDIISKYFNAKFEIVSYKIEFESRREMFDYIKKSGVSGGEKVLDFKIAKKLYKEYPFNYLEFEVLYITSFSKS